MGLIWVKLIFHNTLFETSSTASFDASAVTAEGFN